jgi:hypothetical protein
MASEIRVNTINNRSGLGTISITNSGAVFSGVTTFAQIKTTSGEVTVGTGASVYSPATNVLALGTNNAERVRITSSGNVGIGTDNPTTNFKLDVNGDLSLGEYGGSDNTYIDQKQNGSLDIINSGREADGGGVRINKTNTIAGDTTYYRDFEVYDGKDSKIIEVDGSSALTRIHMGTDKVVQFQGNIGEIGSVTGFQATNTAGSANTDFGIRATTIRFATGNSERLRIDSSGNAILKTANAAFKAENPNSSGDYLRMYAGSGTSQWDIYTNGELLRMGDNSSSSTAKVQFDNPTFHRSTSTTTGVAALTAKQEVNNGGYLIFDGKNSSDTTVFSVTHNGRINLSENIVFASGQGIDFSATSDAGGMTSELLDDYEEGSWTPTFNNAGTATYGVRAGRYVKVGNLVYATCHLDIASKNTASGNLVISGLPYTSANVSNMYGVSSSVHGTGWTTARRSLNILLSQNSTTTNAIYHNMTATTQSSNPSITGSDWGFASHDDLGTGNLLFSITYQAA